MNIQYFENYIQKADVLIEAIPYISRFRKKIFIIKYGGSVLKNKDTMKSVLQDLIFLSYVGIKIIFVHGGSLYINNQLQKKGIEIKFHNGIRITDSQTLKVVYQELIKINKKISKGIAKLKGNVVSIVPESNVITAKKNLENSTLGFVGEVEKIDFSYIKENLQNNNILVLCPMGFSREGQLYNINADTVASSIIQYMDIEKFVLLTNVPGIFKDNNKKEIFSNISIKDAQKLISNGVIQEGMIPKIHSCIQALENGVKKVHIVDANLKHALLLEFFTDKGIGTLII